MAYVPGFDGVRVPARYLMLVALFLACLAGYGAAALLALAPEARRRCARGGRACSSLLESWAGPFQTNTRLAAEGYEATPRELRMANDLPPIYKVLRDDPRSRHPRRVSVRVAGLGSALRVLRRVSQASACERVLRVFSREPAHTLQRIHAWWDRIRTPRGAR